MSERSESPPPAYDAEIAKEPWTNHGPSTIPSETDVSRDRTQRGKWGTHNRGFQAGMHLMFAMILLSLGVGFVIRAAHRGHGIIAEYPTPVNRRTIIHSTSNNIMGDYQLLDLLDLKTTSGTIYVTVSPGPADKDKPAEAAIFVAETSSGSIKANVASLARIPHREYITRVSTTSGSISGTYLMGPTTTFKTTSGSIHLSLLPAAYGSDPLSVVTSGHSDDQVVVILPSQDRAALQTLSIDARSISGTVTVQCPGDFEGTIQAGSTSGDISVSGPAVEIIRDDHTHGSKYVEAIKGDGTGWIVVNTVSGSVRVFVG